MHTGFAQGKSPHVCSRGLFCFIQRFRPVGDRRSPIAAAAAAVIIASSAAASTATAPTTAAVSASTPTTAAAIAAASAAATESASSAAALILWRAGFVHGQCSAFMLLTIERRDGGIRFGIRAHLNKTEALASAGFAVTDDLGRLDRAVL